MKHTYPLKTCPWCDITAEFRMNCNEATWLVTIGCKNMKCHVQPSTKYIPIRKKQRQNAQEIRRKIEILIDRWNNANLNFKNEGFVLDFDKIVEDFLNGKLGLPGYRQES